MHTPDNHVPASPIIIPAEFMVSANVPRDAVFTQSAGGWKYQFGKTDDGKVTIDDCIQSECLDESPVDIDALSSALDVCKVGIFRKCQGTSLFKYMFRAPSHDSIKEDGTVTRQGFACYLDMNGYPMRAVSVTAIISPPEQTSTGVSEINAEGTSSRPQIGYQVYVAKDPLLDGKFISPSHPEPSSLDEVMQPIITTTNDLDKWSNNDKIKPILVDPENDLSRTLILFSIPVIAPGYKPETTDPSRILDIQYIYLGQNVSPIDNSSRPFRIVDGNCLLYPLPADRLITTTSPDSDSGIEGIGKAIISLASYYMVQDEQSDQHGHIGTTRHGTEDFQNISKKIAKQLAGMLQNNASVRKAIANQLYQKVGTHLFQGTPDGQGLMADVFKAAQSSDKIVLTVNLDHTFTIAIPDPAPIPDNSPSLNMRQVTLKDITILLSLQ